MYTIAHAEPFVSLDSWAPITALQETRSAMASLEDAGAALIALLRDSDWACDGVRALHDLFGIIRDRTGEEMGHLTMAEWELEAVVFG